MAELETLSFEDIYNRLLLSQYKKPNFKALMNIIAAVFEDIQTNNFQLRDKFWLSDATGEQLDFIGRLWGEYRAGESDDVYRAKIIAKIGQSSSGTIEEIRNFCKILFGATYVDYSPEYPAGYRIRTDASITYEQLQLISPSGVMGFLAAYILDANGNNLVDYFGNKINHVSTGSRENIVDAEGEQILDTLGQPILSYQYY